MVSHYRVSLLVGGHMHCPTPPTPRLEILAAAAEIARPGRETQRALTAHSRSRFSYVVCVLLGLAIGFSGGDRVFPYIETILGDPLADIVLGLVGAVFAAIAWEGISELRGAFSRLH